MMLGLVLATVLAFGCTAMTGKTASETVDDAGITAAVKTKLAEVKFGTITKIDVDTTRGTVYLNGIVDDASMKSRATEVARAVSGVKDVVNNLQVKTQ
jgi:osmotically-inducible protein OsmY